MIGGGSVNRSDYEAVRGIDFDMRDLSDEALAWAHDESRRLDLMPRNRGEWQATMAIAFEAGRIFERRTAKGRQAGR